MLRSRGFTYIGLLIAVVLLGIGLALVGEVWNTAVKRDRERELLFVGDQFRQAIGRYYESSPGVKQYPRKLEDLLEDKRFPVMKRYLRRIYLDPMTGKADWGLVMQGDQILGVYSPSKDTPIKVASTWRVAVRACRLPASHPPEDSGRRACQSGPAKPAAQPCDSRLARTDQTMSVDPAG